MAYRKKEDWLNEAARLGIDTTGMSWPELQKTVSKALKAEELGVTEKPKQVAKKRINPAEQAYKPYVGKTIRVSPEMAPERYRLAKYDEDLGSEVEVEEKIFETGDGMTFSAGRDLVTGTYRITGHSGRRVIATSTVPKENSGMEIVLHDNPDIPVLTAVTWRGKKGLLWTHYRLPNVKEVLREMGIFEKYRDLFNSSKHPENIWYAAGKQLVVDPSVVYSILEKEVTKYRSEHGIS